MKKYFIVKVKKKFYHVGTLQKLVYAYDKDHAINLASILMGGISPINLTAKKL